MMEKPSTLFSMMEMGGCMRNRRPIQRAGSEWNDGNHSTLFSMMETGEEAPEKSWK